MRFKAEAVVSEGYLDSCFQFFLLLPLIDFEFSTLCWIIDGVGLLSVQLLLLLGDDIICLEHD